MIERHFPIGEPTIAHRASIADWHLTVSFLSKEQCKLFIADLIALEFDIDIEFECVDNGELHE